MFKVVDRAQARRDAAGNPDASVTHVHGSPVRRGQATVSDRSQPTQQAHYNTRSPAATDRSYLDRPLPAPPLGEKMLLERPSTSGGPSSKTQSASGVSKFNSKYNNNNKRVSRDDFYVNTKSSSSNSKVYGKQQYAASHGHLPSSNLTSPRTKAYKHQFSASHGHLPRQRTPSQPAVPIVRLTTPATMSDQSAPIGMALGSPTHPPEMSNGGTLRPHQMQPATSPLSSVESVDSFDMPKEKKQPGKRRLFGLFGRKRSEAEPSPVSISEPNQLGRAYRPDQQVGSHSPNEVRPKHSRSKTAHDHKALTQKSTVKRSQTLPDAHEQSSTLAPTGLRAHGPSIDTQRSTANFGSIPIVLDSPTQESTPAPSFLNIEIPKSNMERYSVMFQGVLGTQPNNTSSLLARRQATSKELKKISDAIIAEEVGHIHPNSKSCSYISNPRQDEKLPRPRRATSPQPSKSPQFFLFPAAPTGRRTPQQATRPWKTVRSNTSPALLPSPSKATFDQSLEAHAQSGHPAQHHVGRAAISHDVKSSALPAPSFHFGPNESGLVLESPSDIDSPTIAPEIIRTSTSKHKIQEPDWQILEPSTYTLSSGSSSATSARKTTPSSASSAQTHMTPPPSSDLDEPDNIDYSHDPVQISIARQISISREQRKLLKPLETSFTLRAKASPARASPVVPRIGMAENERLAETRSATPTLVVPRQTLDADLAQHRKSERIIIEG
ncbi:hypothetical protein PFICI_05726 [Pestalotiopsis fici W106-1]|uniref:Uncharacterized protein n=1 Tax=Pestalotiopsis fici (strain W106-1 / CGMCC3.15140) TaxID=1229662 RepID=W3XCR4_PESFW|nr:uncharacterized protein PFICI_05726 [Pestalotiopsis fici W106-1]ETS83850.1 hypothetical protein PFICI_05726 [Pestalotiopsis fici W106-1]